MGMKLGGFKRPRWGRKRKSKAERGSRLLRQVIPADDADGSEAEDSPKRRKQPVNRPGFSLPLMTNNFRRFNAR